MNHLGSRLKEYEKKGGYAKSAQIAYRKLGRKVEQRWLSACISRANKQLLPKDSSILTNLTAAFGQQLLIPKPPNHVKEQDVKKPDLVCA